MNFKTQRKAMGTKTLMFAVIAAQAVSASGREDSTAAPARNFTWAKLIWGPETNGYAAGASVTFIDQQNLFVKVQVRRSDTNATPEVRTNFMIGPKYLAATNWFCGPIEVKDAEGKRVPILNPNVNSMNSYPETLSWSGLFYTGGMWSGPTPGDRSVFRSENTAKIAFFNLKDYFQLNGKEKYQMTIWPKIYLRTDSDPDSYRRIDVSPVTVVFTLPGFGTGQAASPITNTPTQK